MPKLNRANSQSTEPSVINLDSDDEDLVVLDANRGTDKENDKLRENSNNNGNFLHFLFYFVNNKVKL